MSTDLDFRAEGEYILLCSIFYTWKHDGKPALQKGSVAGLSFTWGIRGGRETSASTEQFLLPDLSSYEVLLQGKSG